MSRPRRHGRAERRFGAAHGRPASSWTQTRVRVDDADITDPDGSGTPLLLPGVLEWDRADVRTGAMPIEVNAAGLAIDLTPRRPTAQWMRRVDLFGAPPEFVSSPFLTTAPTISRLNMYANGSGLVSGPIIPDRLGIVAAGSWMRSSRFDRTDPTELTSEQASFFTHLVFTPNAVDEVRVIGWAQHTITPFTNRVAFEQPTSGATDNAVHGQAVWEWKVRADQRVSASGSYSVRQRNLDLTPTASIFSDSIVNGPVSLAAVSRRRHRYDLVGRGAAEAGVVCGGRARRDPRRCGSERRRVGNASRVFRPCGRVDQRPARARVALDGQRHTLALVGVDDCGVRARTASSSHHDCRWNSARGSKP